MQQIIEDVMELISQDVQLKMPKKFEEKYYEKMNYSKINTVLESKDGFQINKTIGFEIAFIHVITYFLSHVMNETQNYMYLLCLMDNDRLFSWYKIESISIISKLDICNLISQDEIYELINEHDKFIDKDVKKKLGQFYTPISIVRRMISEIKNEIKLLTKEDLIIDPACGTGVFVIETLKQIVLHHTFDELLEYIENNVYAYDVSPFAVIATKMSVINMLIDIAPDSSSRKKLISNVPTLQNIKWKNTIVEKDDKKFSIILGNPPYFKMDSKLLKDMREYDAVIYGQPNIYSLFMHWGICHLINNGIMNFIVPQSIRSGLYFKKIREEIKDIRIKSILHINSRQNIFDRAEQAVLIICLQNKPVRNTKTRVQFINGNQSVLSEFSISRSKLMMGKDNNYMFIINKTPEMYNILEKLHNNATTLSDDKSAVKFSNGLFVWNQHKDSLEDSSSEAIPIVFGGDVQPVNFQFHTSWANKERKSFAQITAKTRPYVLTGKRLLVQRTTNFERDIRLKACLLSEDFLEKYNAYFLENHVNFLCYDEGVDKLATMQQMNLYLGLLNSKLINSIFISKSGNTQVSANELNLLPFPKYKVNDISEFVSQYSLNLLNHQIELDRLICEAYELTDTEINFIINY